MPDTVMEHDVKETMKMYEVFRLYRDAEGQLRDEHLLTTLSLTRAEALVMERQEVQNGDKYVLQTHVARGTALYRTDGQKYLDMSEPKA